jgi:Helix-turn-helix domain
MSPDDASPVHRQVGDARTLRAPAHPLRMSLHELIEREGAMAAARAARELDISQALASHHLCQLAKYGLVQQAPPSDNRERPWRVTSTSYSWVVVGRLGTDRGRLITPLAARRVSGDATARPENALPVDLTIICAPLARTPSGG